MDASPLNPEQIAAGSVVADTIRKWYPTVCYAACLNQPPQIRISYNSTRKLGEFSTSDHAITMYAIPTRKRRGNYLFTLAHEVRHAWQIYYQQGPTEMDADEWAAKFLKHYETGPVIDPSVDPIHGEPSNCSSGHVVLAGFKCYACAEEYDRIKRVRDAEEHAAWEKRLQGREAWEQQEIEEARRLKKSAAVAKEMESLAAKNKPGWFARRQINAQLRWQQSIDHHPDNGKLGWWLVDGTFYCKRTHSGRGDH